MKMDCEALFWGTSFYLIFLSAVVFVFPSFYSDSGELHVHENDLEQCHYFYL